MAVQPAPPGASLEELIRIITQNNESLRNEGPPKPYTTPGNLDGMKRALQKLSMGPGFAPSLPPSMQYPRPPIPEKGNIGPQMDTYQWQQWRKRLIENPQLLMGG